MATEDLALSPLSKSPDDEIEEEQCPGCFEPFGNCRCHNVCQAEQLQTAVTCIVWELSPRVPSCIQVLELDTVAPETMAPDEVPLQDVSNLFDIDERPIHITVLKEHLEMCGLPVPEWVLDACAN